PNFARLFHTAISGGIASPTIASSRVHQLYTVKAGVRAGRAAGAASAFVPEIRHTVAIGAGFESRIRPEVAGQESRLEEWGSQDRRKDRCQKIKEPPGNMKRPGHGLNHKSQLQIITRTLHGYRTVVRSISQR